MGRLSTKLLLTASILTAAALFIGTSSAMTKYDWLPSESAPRGYPMEILDGAFHAGEEDIFIPRGKPINNGWGMFGTIRDIGEELKPVPGEMSIRYFSFLEDRFYGGRFALPTAKIEGLFKEGFADYKTGKRGTYDRIVAGVATEGHVSVWLSGGGYVREVATYRADPVEIRWKEFKPQSRFDRAGYIDVMVKGALGEQPTLGVIPGQFERYRTQYPWRFEIVGDFPAHSMKLSTFNGEVDFFNLTRPIDERQERAVPREVRIDWVDAASFRYGAQIEFDENEAFRAFEKVATEGEGQMALVFEIADTNRTVSILLKNDGVFYEFEKAGVRVHRRSPE